MITFLVPTFNEKENILLFVESLKNLNLNFQYDILFVDDNSNDGTLKELIKVKNNFYNVNYIVRKEKDRDLTQSLVFSFKHIKNKYTFILDCDLQHDLKKIQIIFDILIYKKKDLVIGSRFLKNGQNIFLSKKRTFESKLGILLCYLLGIKNIKDPLSGFFFIKTFLLLNVEKRLKTRGFKILLSILYLYKSNISVSEVPIKFNKRQYGKSKLNFKIKILFLIQLIKLKFFLNKY